MSMEGSGETVDMAAVGRYPEVEFGLDIPIDFKSSDEEMMRTIVDHSLSELNYIRRTTFEDEMPEGVVPMFNYDYSRAVEQRHRSFLSQTVRSPRKEVSSKKASIVEEDKAAQQVVDDLSINRHPVSQLIEQLREMHGSHIGPIALSDIVISLVKHTAYSRFRATLNSQIASWSPEVETEPPVRAGMKGRPKPIYKPAKKTIEQNGEAGEQVKSSRGKQRVRNKVRTVKTKSHTARRSLNTAVLNGKAKVEARNVDTTQRLPRGMHQRMRKSPRLGPVI